MSPFPMFRFQFPLVLVFLLAGLGACSRYVPIPWMNVSGQFTSIADEGRKIVSALEEELRKNQKKVVGRRGGNRGLKNKKPARALRVVLAAFPEARTGVRTHFSERLERAIRKELEKSPLFQVVDAGDGVTWQESGFSPEAVIPRPGASGVFGRVDEEIAIGKESGRGPEAIREELERLLDGDHPFKGFWLKVKNGSYGENSAVFAASMLDADAAVFGGYALGPDRVRVWAAIVMNRSSVTRYYRRGLKDILGLPEFLENSRPYAALVRSQIPRGSVPDSWLSLWMAPRPRTRPRHPGLWAERALEVQLSQIDEEGRRYPLKGGEIFGSGMLVVGRVRVKHPRYVFGFALDRSGQVEMIMGGEGGKPVLIEPGKGVPFSARLLPAGRAFRVYFVSSGAPFETGVVVENALKRLGISGSGSESAANHRDVARGLPRAPWFVPPGQDRLILGGGWDQFVYWFQRVPR